MIPMWLYNDGGTNEPIEERPSSPGCFRKTEW
jgi:hypothetical protein